MANKLKNIRLTSVDLVQAGANQEADICLYKSLAAPDDTPPDLDLIDIIEEVEDNRFDDIEYV